MLDAAMLELFLALCLGGAVWLGWILRGFWERLGAPRQPATPDHATPEATDDATDDAPIEMPDDKPADPR